MALDLAFLGSRMTCCAVCDFSKMDLLERGVQSCDKLCDCVSCGMSQGVRSTTANVGALG